MPREILTAMFVTT